ncbi:MAG: lasso peptide biosynthesis B2 protein [Gemmatimonadaceae bacterium]|nr:lasso peptide biosynthesis B2 protein [Gemmatimonadaceae bacterium]
MRAALSLLSFAALRARIERAGTAGGAANAAVARAVRRAVERAARTVPGSACLAQAFTAELMLRRAACQVSTSIGVSSQGEPLPAHAWVESSGIIVTGDVHDLQTYARLVSFGAPSRSSPTGGA